MKQAACLLALTETGRVLTVTRRGTQLLSLPGGKCDGGETAIQAARRETHEETGLLFRVERLIPLYAEVLCGSDGNDFFCTTFGVVVDEQRAIDGRAVPWQIEEGISVQFSTIEQLLGGAFSAYNQRVIVNALKVEELARCLKNTRR